MERKEIGKWGETKAAEYLQTHQYRMREKNWQCGHYEIDLIVQADDVIVFIEVKTRTSAAFGNAEDFVSSDQLERIASAGSLYMEQFRLQLAMRIDIIGITFISGNNFRLNHIQDVYGMGWDQSQ